MQFDPLTDQRPQQADHILGEIQEGQVLESLPIRPESLRRSAVKMQKKVKRIKSKALIYIQIFEELKEQEAAYTVSWRTPWVM